LTDQNGVFHIPLALLMTLLCSVVFSFVGLMNEHKKQIRLQLALDRCIGSLALDFKHKNIAIEKTNLEMKALRTSLLAGDLTPVTAVAIRASIVALSLYENALLVEWNTKRLIGLGGLTCSTRSTLLPLPGLPWSEQAADADGPKPLSRDEDYGKGFMFSIWESKQSSGARVFYEQGDLINGWKSEWAGLD
jgi:hypothetical protein